MSLVALILYASVNFVFLDTYVMLGESVLLMRCKLDLVEWAHIGGHFNFRVKVSSVNIFSITFHSILRDFSQLTVEI